MSGHGHDHSACAHEHAEHDHGEDEGGEAWALYEKVDTAALICLNEAQPASLRHVLRPWHQRLDTSLPMLVSDCDDQLLMCIPFTAPVKIKSISVIGPGGEDNPAEMSAFINRENMDFSSAESTTPVQTWQLSETNPDGLLEYPTRYTKFQVRLRT